MNKTLKVIWNVTQVLIIIYVIFVTSLLFFENKYGFSQLGNSVIYNVNKSDIKNISKVNDGDLLIIKKSSKLKEENIIYYYAVSNDKYVIAKDKIAGIKKDKDDYLYTLGEDNRIIISSSRVVGNRIIIIPFIGKILGIVKSRIGFIFFVLFPIIIVFVYQLYEFLHILRYEKVEDKAIYADDEIL